MVPVVGPWQRPPGGRFTSTIAIRAPGQPPTMPSALVSTDGTERVTVAPVALAGCDRATPRDTGLADSRVWCLQLDGLAPGHTVTGKLFASSVILNLTVVPRDPWLPWPALTVLIGLILAVVVLMSPERLSRSTARLRLWDGLAHNKTIIGLDREWVQSLITNGKLRVVEPTFVAMVLNVIAIGPRRLDADRKRLALAVAGCPLPRDKPLLAAAAEEARTDASPRCEDFFTEDGTVRVQTPPEEWLTRIGRADMTLAAIGRLRDRLSEVHDPTVHARLESDLNQLIEQIANAGPDASATDAELTIAEDGVGEASRAIRDAVAEPAHELEQLVTTVWIESEISTAHLTMFASSSVAFLLGLPSAVRDLPSALGHLPIRLVLSAMEALAQPTSRLASWRYRILLWLTGFGIAAVLMIVAAAAVFSAAYINTGAFGTPADYLKLGVAAFGSTALTGVAGILLTIRRPRAA